MDFAGKRYWYFLLSLLLIGPGLVFLAIAPGLKPGIDFTGGSALQLKFADQVAVSDLRAGLASLGQPDANVDRLEGGSFFIRTKTLGPAARETLLDGLKARLSPSGVEVESTDQVSAVVARETVTNGIWAVVAGTVGIFLYIWWAFRSVPSPVRYGAAAIIALVHDVAAVVGIFAFLGVVAGVEVNTMFLIALLTVIGYSINDTIVVFDRLRENILFYPHRPLSENVNLSVSETLGRSLNTSITTIFSVLAMMLFGGPTIREFLLVLLFGVVVGTYSSIGIAASLLVTWEEGDVGRFVRWLRAPRLHRAKPSPAP